MKRLDKMALVIQKYDNVMVPKSSNIDVVLEEMAENYQSCTNVRNNTSKIRITIADDSFSSLVTAKALNLHELGHVLFTRSPNTLVGSNEHNAYDILEDQRVEWVLSRKFPGMRKYFSLLVSKLMPVKDPNFLWGRRFFLPFQVTEPRPEIRQIIDSYLVAKTQREREELAIKFAELTCYPSENYVNPTQTFSNGKGETEAEKKASKDAENMIDSENLSEQDEKEQEVGAEAEEDEEVEDETLDEMMTQAISDVVQDISAPIIKQAKPRKLSTSPTFSLPDTVVLAKMTRSVFTEYKIHLDRELEDKFYQVFKNAKIELQSKWNRGFRSGRLNLRKAMTSNGGNLKIFNRFTQSNLREGKFSLVILFDTSWSMDKNDPYYTEQKAVVALSSAAMRAGNEVCAISFDDEARISK